MAELTYLGHSAFSLRTNKAIILFDPFLTGNPLATAKAGDVDCDYIILSHGHIDHVGDAIAIAKRNNATIIANYELTTWCEQQETSVHPMHIGGAYDFDFGRVKLTIAHHGSGYADGDNMVYMGNPAGILVTTEGKTLFHAGDTGLFYDMKLIGEMNAIDIALLPVGDNFTMGLDDAAKAVEFLNSKLAIPMHYDTFDLIKADPEAFVSMVRKIGKEAKVLAIGDTLEI